MKPPLRTKSVGIKVSEAEFAALEVRARARKLTVSEWVRAELLEPKGEGGGAADDLPQSDVLADERQGGDAGGDVGADRAGGRGQGAEGDGASDGGAGDRPGERPGAGTDR